MIEQSVSSEGGYNAKPHGNARLGQLSGYEWKNEVRLVVRLGREVFVFFLIA